MNKFKKLLIYWAPVFIWATVIFLFSANPAIKTSQIHWKDFFIKKTAHVTEYFIFTVILYRAYKSAKLGSNSMFYAILTAIIYAASDEFHQWFTPGREPTIRDVGFDVIGATFAFYFLTLIIPRLPDKYKKLAQKFEIV